MNEIYPDKSLRPFNREAFEVRRAHMAFKAIIQNPEEIYRPKVARSFGNIEYIIHRAFKDRVPVNDVVKEIEDVLEEIKKELQ